MATDGAPNRSTDPAAGARGAQPPTGTISTLLGCVRTDTWVSEAFGGRTVAVIQAAVARGSLGVATQNISSNQLKRRRTTQKGRRRTGSARATTRSGWSCVMLPHPITTQHAPSLKIQKSRRVSRRLGPKARPAAPPISTRTQSQPPPLVGARRRKKRPARVPPPNPGGADHATPGEGPNRRQGGESHPKDLRPLIGVDRGVDRRRAHNFAPAFWTVLSHVAAPSVGGFVAALRGGEGGRCPNQPNASNRRNVRGVRCQRVWSGGF